MALPACGSRLHVSGGCTGRKDLFTKQDGCLVTVDSRKRMKIAGRIKHAICDLLQFAKQTIAKQADALRLPYFTVDVRMPDLQVAEGLG